MTKKVLITGGAGFIGSHVADLLKKNKYEVIIYDNLTSGFKKNVKGYKFIKGDIRNFALLEKSTKGVDYIIHNAALISVPESIEHPELYNDVNINGTFNVLMAAKNNNLKKVIFISSAAIYGNAKPPISENTQTECLSSYALTKLIGEQYCQYFTNTYNLQTVVLRYFNVFGERQSIDSPYAAAIPIFMNNHIQNKESKIFGDGNQTRDFIYVKDIAMANLLAIKQKEANGKTFNIATGTKMSLNQLLKLFPKNFKFTYGAQRPGDIKHSSANTNLSKKILGNYIKHDFKKALDATFSWYKTQ